MFRTLSLLAVCVTSVLSFGGGSNDLPAEISTECSGTQDCFGTQDEFTRTCSRIGGLRDGGRCFFRTSTAQNWYDGIKACGAQGGRLVMVLGSTEALKLYELVKNDGFSVNDAKLWYHTALARSTATTSTYGMVLRHTVWYETASTFHPRLTAANTYIRAYETDEVFGKDQNCLVLYDFNKFGDWGCGSVTRAMCMLNNKQQSFRIVRNVCVTEEPAEEYYNTDPQECANKCSNFVWCRSFNFYDDHSCRLYSWSVKDNPAARTNQPWCTHYTYNH